MRALTTFFAGISTVFPGRGVAAGPRAPFLDGQLGDPRQGEVGARDQLIGGHGGQLGQEVGGLALCQGLLVMREVVREVFAEVLLALHLLLRVVRGCGGVGAAVGQWRVLPLALMASEEPFGWGSPGCWRRVRTPRGTAEGESFPGRSSGSGSVCMCRRGR